MEKDPRKESGRYDVSELVEAQFEPDSRRRVLKNLLGIKRKREMDRVNQALGSGLQLCNLG